MSTSSGITRSKVCRKCGIDKLIDAFGRDKRTPDGYAQTCTACRGNGRPAKAEKQKAARARKPPKSEPVAEPEIGPALRIDIAPGLGVSAWVENGCLQLAQGEDVVALSQTEARVLFAQFADWTEKAA